MLDLVLLYSLFGSREIDLIKIDLFKIDKIYLNPIFTNFI